MEENMQNLSLHRLLAFKQLTDPARILRTLAGSGYVKTFFPLSNEIPGRLFNLQGILDCAMQRAGYFLLGWVFFLMQIVPANGQESILPVLNRADSLQAENAKTLFLRLSNNNFLFDAEYFSPLEDGYTWIGLQFQPEIFYQVSQHFLIHGGVYLLKYSGRKEISDVRPVFSVTYQFNPAVSLIMGTLYGSLNHHLPEPLYQYDRSIFDYPEEGVQTLVHTSWMEGDYWLQWRNFILPGDPHQEELVFGTSSLFKISSEDMDWRFSIPVYTLINHRGGQIDASPRPVHTFGNLATGVKVDKDLSGSLFHDLVLRMVVYDYFDQSGTALFPLFSSGFALQPEAEVSGKTLSLRGGYWYGHDFYSLLGEPLFATASGKTGFNAAYHNRRLLTLKVQFQKNFEKGLNFFFYGNGFYDLGLGRFDYNVGLQMLFNMDVRLAGPKR